MLYYIQYEYKTINEYSRVWLSYPSGTFFTKTKFISKSIGISKIRLHISVQNFFLLQKMTNLINFCKQMNPYKLILFLEDNINVHANAKCLARCLVI